MDSSVSIGIVIGGAVAASLRQSLADTTKSIGQLDKEIQHLAQQRGLVKAFNETQKAAQTASTEYFSAKRSVEALKHAMAAAGQPVKGLQSALSKAYRELEATRRQLDAGKAALKGYRGELQAAGIDVSKLASEEARLATQLQRAERLKAADGRVSAVNAQRRALRGEAGGLAASAVGIGYTLKAALAPAIELEAALKRVEARVNFKSPDGLIKLRADMQALAEETGIAVSELASTAALGGQFGIAGEQISGFVRQAAEIGVAFGISTAQAGESIATLATVLQLPIDGVGQLLDAVNELANNSKASEAGILEVLGRVGGIGKQFGLANEQIAALASTFLSLGKSPEVAATGINALLNKLQTAGVQSDSFKAALQGLVGDVKAFTRSIDQDAQGALQTFLRELGKLDNRSRAEAITELFGQEYADDISLLAGATAEYNKQLKLVGDSASYAGSAQKEFKRQSQGTAVELAKTTEALNAAFAELGVGLLPVINSLTEAVRWVARLLKETGAVGQTVLTSLALLLGGGLLAKAARLGFGLIKTEATAAFTLIDKLAEVTLGKRLGEFAAQGVARTGLELGKLSSIASAALRGLSGVLGAAFAGWEIGTYLRNEFELVNKAGVALASGLHIIAIKVQGYFAEAFVSLKYALSNPLDFMREKYASFVADLGQTIAKIPLFGQAAGEALIAAADKLKSNGASADKYRAELKTVQDATQQSVQTARDGYLELFQLSNKQADLGAEQVKTEAEAAAALAKINDGKVANETRAASQIKALKDEVLSKTKESLDALVAAEKAAAGELEKAKKAQLDTEKRYSDARAQLHSAPAGEANFSQAADLKVAARQSLKKGDIEGAKRQAQAALKVILALQAAGANSYGFDGFVKELQQIETAADGIATSDAENALAAIKEQAAQLAKDLAELTKLSIDPKLSPEAAAQVEADILALAARLKAALTIQVTTVRGDLDADGYAYLPPLPPPPKFAGGGHIRGPGTGTSDSILARLSNGEFVVRADAVQHYGTALLAQLNARSLPKFATGGLIGGGAMPRVPAMNLGLAAALAPPQGRDLGRVSLNIGDETHSLLADADSFSRILKTTALKFGRTHKN